MSKLHIFTDSASDITLQELKDLDVELVPLTLTIQQKSLLDDKTIESSYLWNLLESGEDIKTSQPSPETFIESFKEMKENDEEGIFIGVSSVLSGTYQCSLLAKNIMEYDKIHLVDTLSAAPGQKLFVYRACQMRNEGKSAAEIVDELNAMVLKVKIYAVLDTLKYLGKSGRIPKSVASVGDVVKVKPLVTISEGKVEVVKMLRGKKKAMAEVRKIFAEANVDYSHAIIPVYSKYTENTEELIEPLGLEQYPLQEIGMTIGTHIGPGAFGVVFVEK